MRYKYLFIGVIKRVTPVIAAVNVKGGVGKTTTSIALSLALAKDKIFNKGKPVLIIDLAPQCCMSRYWGLARVNKVDGSSYPVTNPELNGYKTEYSSVSDLFLMTLYNKGLSDIEESLVPVPYKTRHELIHVVPSHENNMFSLASLSSDKEPELAYNLRNWLRSDDIKNNYSCVIIDTPPVKSVLIEAAIIAATAVYIPFILEPQSIDGVFSTIAYIALKNKLRGDDVRLQSMGLLANMFEKNRLDESQLKFLRDCSELEAKIMPVQFNRSIEYAGFFVSYKNIENHSDYQSTHMFAKAQLFALHTVRMLTDFRS